MIIFEYKVSPAWLSPTAPKYLFRITVTDNKKENVTTWFNDKEYLHTIPIEDIEKIKNIIKSNPELFNIPEHLEPNGVLDGEEYDKSGLHSANHDTKKLLIALEIAKRI